MGWGSNSQWARDFRRDYETPDAFEFNFDYGAMDKISTDRSSLSLVQRRELVMFRSYLVESVADEGRPLLFHWAVRRAKP